VFACSLGEQRHRIAERQRVDPVGMFAVDAERELAGGEDANPQSGPQERCHQFGDRVDDVLAVVEHDQHVRAAQALDQGRLGGAVGVERDGDGVTDRFGRAGCFETHEPGAVGRLEPPSHLEREARLADAGRADERHEPVRGEKLARLRALAVSADQ
jgi:hypothetical protein